MTSLRTHPLAVPALLLAGSVLPLAFALATQHLGGLAPCHFCLLQRYPYVLVALCGLLALMAPYRGLRQGFWIALGVFGWLATALLGLIHSGIERGLLAYKGGCVAEAAADTSIDALRAQITGAPIVACNDVSASFLGLSMAGWNVLLAFVLIAITLCLYRLQRSPA